jgi:hypothetical protein
LCYNMQVVGSFPILNDREEVRIVEYYAILFALSVVSQLVGNQLWKWLDRSKSDD